MVLPKGAAAAQIDTMIVTSHLVGRGSSLAFARGRTSSGPDRKQYGFSASEVGFLAATSWAPFSASASASVAAPLWETFCSGSWSTCSVSNSLRVSSAPVWPDIMSASEKHAGRPLWWRYNEAALLEEHATEYPLVKGLQLTFRDRRHGPTTDCSNVAAALFW